MASFITDFKYNIIMRFNSDLFNDNTNFCNTFNDTDSVALVYLMKEKTSSTLVDMMPAKVL